MDSDIRQNDTFSDNLLNCYLEGNFPKSFIFVMESVSLNLSFNTYH